MSDYNPSIVSHVSLGSRNLAAAAAFYDAVLACIGARRQQEITLPDQGLVAVAYGKQFPEFWIQLPDDRQTATVGNGVHVGFIADDKQSVHDFYDKAIQHGGCDNGAPGPRPHYGEAYYGCFVFDPDGNKIEATFWDNSLATPSG